MSSDDQLLIWAHDLADYQAMFDLKADDFDKQILEFASGISSFNSEMQQRGRQVISCDPLFQMTKPDMTETVQQGVEAMVERVDSEQQFQVEQARESFWHEKQTIVSQFLQDFDQGCQDHRYLACQQPPLPFADNHFDLLLCSHFFFGARLNADVDSHLQWLNELTRLANEVRIYPLLDDKGQVSPLVGPLALLLQQQHFGVEIREISYQFQKNSNAMLRIWATTCQLDQ